MKYEFHVGDYVETNTGSIGFVSEIPEKGLIHWIPTKVSDNDTSLYDVGDSYCTPFPTFPLYNNFNRIGQYDFNKKAEDKNDNKIEPLNSKHPTDYCNSKLMWDKINELVEAVNRLEDKINGMAQS